MFGPALVQSGSPSEFLALLFGDQTGDVQGAGNPAGNQVQQPVFIDSETPGDTPPVYPGSEPEQSPSAEENEEPLPFLEVGAGFDRNNFDILQASPASYKGKSATLSGQVYNIDYQSSAAGDIVSLRINVHHSKPSEDSDRAVILYQGPTGSMPSIAAEECISIQGTVRGSTVERSSLGQDIVIPAIDAASINRIECIDSSMPALAGGTEQAGDSQTLSGITLTAERVQFAKDHVRIELAVENWSAGSSVFIREAYAVQDGVKYADISSQPVFAKYRLDAHLVPETKSTGYLFFESTSTTFGDGGRSISQEKPISFRIVVEESRISGNTESVFIFTV